MAQLHLRLKALYEKEGGAFPDPILNLHWPYKDPDDPTPEELAKEINGYGARGRPRSDRPDQGRSLREGQAGRRASPRCATTARPRAAAGSTPAASTRAATTWPAATTAIPTTPASISNWAFVLAGQPPHPLQPRLGRPRRASRGIRAQADRVGRREVDGLRRARHRADREAGRRSMPFIMNPEGVVAPVRPRHDARRAVPGALRAVRKPGRQPDRPEDPGQSGGARVQGRHGAVRRRRRSSRTWRRPTA